MSLQVQEASPAAKDTQSHLLKVRQLMAPEMVANEPDQDQTEVFLAAAERGESAKVRKVRQHRQPGHPPRCRHLKTTFSFDKRQLKAYAIPNRGLIRHGVQRSRPTVLLLVTFMKYLTKQGLQRRCCSMRGMRRTAATTRGALR